LDSKVIPDKDTGLEEHERTSRQPEHRSYASLEVPMLDGPMGTPSHPVVVHSVYDARIVGCRGDDRTQVHEVRWHVVKREKPLVCMDCGQVFVLQTPPGHERVERHHH